MLEIKRYISYLYMIFCLHLSINLVRLKSKIDLCTKFNRMKTFLLIIILTVPLWSFGQEPQIKWWYDTGDMAFGNAALADVDSDSLPEFVFSTYRNDERIIVLNAEDGSLLWDYNTGGCNDVAPLVYDVDLDGELEIILAGSCVPKTWCFDAATGEVEWICNTHGSDSPPTVGDVDNDDKPEILHGEFNGWIICINGENGSIQWEFNADPNAWIQTAPTLLDANGNGQLDFVVANWSFGTNHKIFAFRGDDHSLLWDSDLPEDVMYHGAAVADIDEDNKPELAIGSYDGILRVLNAEDGSLLWDFSFPSPTYIGAPVSIADLNLDEHLEIVFVDWYKLGVLSKNGSLLWDYSIPEYGTSFRGAALSDVNNDGFPDVVIGTSTGSVTALSGNDGSVLWNVDLLAHYGGNEFEIDHGPVIADFDDDGLLDAFVVGGHAEYPNIQNNFGRAYALSLESSGGPDWPMFRRDEIRSACVCSSPVLPGTPDSELTSGMLILPNPSNGKFKVQLSDIDASMLEIIDVFGNVLFREPISCKSQLIKDIDISNRPGGIYILKITSRKETITGTFIIR